MAIRRIRLNRQMHAAFLAEQRKDPITKEFLCDGMEIVICANDKLAFIVGNWPGYCPYCHGTETLSDVPRNRFPDRLGRRYISTPSENNVNRLIKTPWVAAILSFLVFGGGGQIYLGQAAKGIALMILTFLSSFFGIGIFFNLLGTVDAFNTASKINRGENISQWAFSIENKTIFIILAITALFFICCVLLFLVPLIISILNYLGTQTQ